MSDKFDKFSLTEEIAVRSRSIDFYAIGNFFLPNPDPVLKAQGRDISIYNDLLVDDRVAGGMINRTAASKGMVWSIEKGKSGSRQHKAIQSVFEKLQMNRIIEQVLKARAFGYAPIEIMWGLKDGLTVPVDLMLKPQRWFVFDKDNQLCFWRSDMNMPADPAAAQSIFGFEQLPPYKFLCPTNEADYLNPYGLGLLSRCFWPVTFKRGGWKFWIKFAEKYGAVWPVGKLPRSATPEQRQQLLDTLTQMVQDGAAVIPDDGSAEFLESKDKGGTSSLFNDILAAANSAISTVWLGHAGAGESTPGKLGGEMAAVDVRDDLRDDDANLIMQTMQQMIDWTCEVNWGGSDDAPRFALKEKEQIDTTQSERDVNLTTALERSSLKLSRVYFQRIYGLENGDLEDQPVEPTPPKVIGTQTPLKANVFGEGDGTPGQKAIDALVASFSPADMQKMMAPVLQPVLDLLQGEDGYDAAMEKLATVYPDMPTDDLVELVTRLLFIADLYGKYEASQANG